MASTALYPADRLSQAAAVASRAGLDALLVTPGADLRYLTGYDALPLPRLTCLVVRTAGDPVLLVPQLEAPRAQASPAGALGIEIASWAETESPFARVAEIVRRAGSVGVSDRTWAVHAFRLRDAMPGVAQELAGPVLTELRIRKTPAEIEALREAARFIDDVHEEIQTWRVAGRTEREVGRDIADAIIAAGNVRVNFVIVGSGPNGASPHHELAERVIDVGDAVVFDIGGTTADGYCSDITRTYVVGEPPPDFAAYYEVLRQAQEAACNAVRPGVPCEAVDKVARDVITEAGYGEYFIHRTGHGIGLEEHEEPYIVAGNTRPLEPGMAFSIEPGIYLPGRHGARIEDIVVCTESGVEVLDRVDRSLMALAG